MKSHGSSLKFWSIVWCTEEAKNKNSSKEKMYSNSLITVLSSFRLSIDGSATSWHLEKMNMFWEGRGQVPFWTERFWRCLKGNEVDMSRRQLKMWLWRSQRVIWRWKMKEFPSGPLVKTPWFHCWGPKFNPWSGN